MKVRYNLKLVVEPRFRLPVWSVDEVYPGTNHHGWLFDCLPCSMTIREMLMTGIMGTPLLDHLELR